MFLEIFVLNRVSNLSFFVLKGLCHPTRMREPMKTNLKKTAQLFQVLSEFWKAVFICLNLGHRSIDSEVLY